MKSDLLDLPWAFFASWQFSCWFIPDFHLSCLLEIVRSAKSLLFLKVKKAKIYVCISMRCSFCFLSRKNIGSRSSLLSHCSHCQSIRKLNFCSASAQFICDVSWAVFPSKINSVSSGINFFNSPKQWNIQRHKRYFTHETNLIFMYAIPELGNAGFCIDFFHLEARLKARNLWKEISITLKTSQNLRTADIFLRL